LQNETNIFILTERPRLHSISFPPSLNVGHPIVTANCIADSGSHPLTFKWYKDGEDFTNSQEDRINIQTDSEYSTLQIKKLRSSDRGNYTCSVTGPSGSDSQSAVLDIKESPSWLQEPPSDMSAILGSRVVIPCKATASPKPGVVWSSLEPSFPRVFTVEDDALIFAAISESDVGRYQCRVSNGVGSPLIKVISIRVNGSFI
jgi:hemicentin